ncbi:MAG: efflux RND transporter periplasmic adaptor subunit [Calditrichaeota bacterium]|nr:efflux RND transporter periplasmic adaptor subunit [Calditrichota bacterium]
MKKRKKRILWISIILLAAACVVGWIMMKQKEEKPSATVTVETASIRSLTATVSAEGTIEPVTQVKISAEIPGRITKLSIKEGDVVQKGDFLVELDPETYMSALDAARSSLKSAQANKLKADADYKRISELVTRGMASQADMDAALASSQLAEADLERSEAQERQSRDNLSKTRLSAPMSGTISVLNKEVGELTLGSQFQEDVILVVADLSKMEVKSDVDENDITSVDLGDTARVEIDAIPDTTFRGIVTEIAQSASNLTGSGDFGADVTGTNFAVRVVLIDSVPGVRPGMSATVDIETDYRYDVLSVPIQSVAVRKKGDGESVTQTRDTEELSSRQMQQQVSAGVLDTTKLVKKDELETGVFLFSEGEAQWLPVRTGIAADRYIEITEGLQEGDSVITGPYRSLARDMKNKDKVALQDEKKDDDKKKDQG